MKRLLVKSIFLIVYLSVTTAVITFILGSDTPYHPGAIEVFVYLMTIILTAQVVHLVIVLTGIHDD